MVDQVKNMLIGLFVIAAIGIFIFVLFFLHPYVGNEERVLHVRFPEIEKVNIGTRVTFAGRPVGEVTDIKEIPEAIHHRVTYHGLVYVYQLTLRVDSSVNVYNSDQIVLRTTGLLGERVVDIVPLPPPPGTPLVLVNKEIIYAKEVAGVESALGELKQVGEKFTETLDAALGVFTDLRKQRLWEKLGASAEHLRHITAALDQPSLISDMLTNAHTFTEQALASLEIVDDSLQNVKAMSEDGKAIIAKIKNGEGTLGRLLERDDLYLKTNALLNKANIIMNDISNYGLLYNLNKSWQRLHARRMNLLNRLSSPAAFNHYFNDQLDRISESLSNVAMILEETPYYPPGGELLQNREYTQVYSELLRQVADIEESIRMYNQQLIDEEQKETEICEK